MATIKHISSDAIYHLPAIAHVGRDVTCEIRLDGPLVSAMHARVSWNGHTWELRDLGSSNGTFLNGTAVAAGAPQPIQRDSRIAFGDPDDAFEMIDNSSPTLAARCGDEWIWGSDSSLELPTPEDPDAVIYCDGKWYIQRFGGEGEEHVAPVQDRDLIEAAGKRWRVYLPVAHVSTYKRNVRLLANVILRVQVSLDNEHVEISYVHEEATSHVRPRAHGQLLLYLARARQDDAGQPELPEAEHGWRYRTEVARALGVEGRLLSLYIWRAKDQARSEAQIVDFGALIESRPDSGQIRLGIARIELLP